MRQLSTFALHGYKSSVPATTHWGESQEATHPSGLFPDCWWHLSQVIRQLGHVIQLAFNVNEIAATCVCNNSKNLTSNLEFLLR